VRVDDVKVKWVEHAKTGEEYALLVLEVRTVADKNVENGASSPVLRSDDSG